MIDIALWDWGAWVVNGIWLLVGGMAGFLIAALMVVSADSDRWAEAFAREAKAAAAQEGATDARLIQVEAALAESEAARVRAERGQKFYIDLYCALLAEVSGKAARRG